MCPQGLARGQHRAMEALGIRPPALRLARTHLDVSVAQLSERPERCTEPSHHSCQQGRRSDDTSATQLSECAHMQGMRTL